LAKIEADKNLKKKVVPKTKVEPEKAAEPKRTVRKIVKDKPQEAAAPVPSFATVPKPATAAATPKTAAVAATAPKSAASTAAAAPASAAPKAPAATKAAAVAEPKKAESTAPKTAAPVAKPLSTQKPTIPKNDVVVNDDNYDLFEAATNVATRRRKSLAEIQARREQQGAAVAAAKSGIEQKEAAQSTAKPGPKGDGAAATKIRNALANATNVRKPETPSPKPEGEKQMKRYAGRRKTQEIVNESAEPKMKKRKQMYKRNRFIRDPHDIDVLLGWDKENTFEKMEQMFMLASKDRINRPPQKKRKRGHGSKIWISDLTDIDKIYKASEIRDIIASANV
uniref:Translation initiation factor IF-2 n=1 Tax=Haemonchus placei TaxID=6290 RepID=A0A0N4VW13_HAEPC